MSRKLVFDRTLFAVGVGLPLFGVVMIYSASAVVAMERFGSPHYFLMRQAAALCVGLAGMAAAISGTLSSIVAIGIGTWFGQQYDGTIMPLVYGFLSMGFVAMLLSEGVEWSKRREVKNPRLVD